MMHKHRRWCVSTVGSAEELARMLTQQTWTLCSGFTVAGHEAYLFLNDATSEDGAGEFGVIQGGLAADRHVQIESITFSWCSPAEALDYVRKTLAGAYDASGCARPIVLRLETPEQHRRCPLCA